MDLDLRSYGIIDPYSSFCQEIHEIIDLSLHFFGGSTEIIDPMYTFYVRSTGIIDPDKKRPRGIKQIHRRKGKLKPLGCIHKNNINCSNHSKQCPEVVPTAKCQLYKWKLGMIDVLCSLLITHSMTNYNTGMSYQLGMRHYTESSQGNTNEWQAQYKGFISGPDD